MEKARAWEPSATVPASEWRRRLVEADAEVGVVLDPWQGDLLAALLLQLGGADLICAYTPVSDALKVVVDGLVVDSIDRTNVVALRPPFAFRVRSALAVVEALDPQDPIDLLHTLAGSLDPLPFHPPLN
ncbi:MAG: hypothetical protein ACRDWA_09900 [Acidimicrobiia bacterium]